MNKSEKNLNFKDQNEVFYSMNSKKNYFFSWDKILFYKIKYQFNIMIFSNITNIMYHIN